MIRGPELRDGFWCWSARWPGARMRFVGRGPRLSVAETVALMAGRDVVPSWLEQTHSGRAVAARRGSSGEADALWTERPGRCLAISTADCAPVLLAGDGIVAAAHAGWRGLVRGVIPTLLAELPPRSGRLIAWIGPSIGGCCYEVGEEVAAQVVRATGPEALWPGSARRPHLDLAAAARYQLAQGGVQEIVVLPHCTRCDERHLWSFRRQGRTGDRNLALIWRRP